MAVNFPLLAVASLLLVSQTLTLTSAEDDDLVRDIVGEPLQVGMEYYMMSEGNPFRGITTSPNPKGDSPCPLYVVESGASKPVKFSHTDPTISQIHLSTDLLIDSGFDAYCRADGIWGMEINPLARRFEVVANGGSSHSNFQIRNKEGSKYGGYTLTYCHGFSRSHHPRQEEDKCEDLGVATIFGSKVLGFPSTSEIKIFFIKKGSDEVALHSTRASH